VRVFNPDDYLITSEGRVFTNERSAIAWESLHSDMDALFSAADSDTRLFIVMGVQGAGKTTWIRTNHEALGASAVFLDAALPAKRHRVRALTLAKRFGIRTIAIWIKVPLQQALAQNAQRRSDEVVPESAVRSVFSLLEAPSIAEGFDEVIVVDGTQPDA
jgi:hypothetical protein